MILGTLDAVLRLSPKYEDMLVIIPLFALIGMSKMIEMGASVNQHILIYSPRFRSMVVFVAIMATINILLNYFLITGMGILGAALSACITTYLYQLLKCFFIDKWYGMHPLSAMTPRILILFLIVMTYYLLLPVFAPPMIQAAVFVIGLLVIYLAGIRLLGIRSDIIETAEQQLSRLVSRGRKMIR
jgi:O-antigen/teichoic acid export membrane protein